MAFIPTANTIEVLMAGTLLGVPANMVFHFNSITNFNQGGAQQVVGNMSTWVTDNALPALPSAYVYRGLFARAINTQTGFVAQNIDNAGLTGDDIDEVSTGQATICITTRTEFAGKSARGRKYWPGVCDSRYTNNRVTPAWLSLVRAALAELVGLGATAPGWTWVVVSLEENKQPRPLGATFPIIAVTATSDVIASQRRRKPKRS